jgi:hypothetical protein
MAIRAAPKPVPRRLNSARLHLDDVEEICGILKDPPASDWKTFFVVGDKECDTLEDLKDLGGRSRKFKINIEAPQRRRELIISEFSSDIDLFDYPADEKLRWSIYAKVDAIFKKRRLGVSGRAGYLLAICLCVGACVLPWHGAWRWFVRIPVAWLATVMVIKMFTQPSVVVLVYSHKAWSIKGLLDDEESRSKLVVATVTAVVTALITIGARMLYDRLAK